MTTTLDQVKRALRITSTVFDGELAALIDAAIDDLEIAGVAARHNCDKPLVCRAVVTYCKTNFGEPDDYDRLKASYDEQKSQLMTATGYAERALADEKVR